MLFIHSDDVVEKSDQAFMVNRGCCSDLELIFSHGLETDDVESNSMNNARVDLVHIFPRLDLNSIGVTNSVIYDHYSHIKLAKQCLFTPFADQSFVRQ